MSKRTGLLTFTGGMNNVKPIHLLSDSEAALIQNLHLNDNGMWMDIGVPDMLIDESEGVLKDAHKIVHWKPAIMPASATDDFVYIVFYTDNNARLVYRQTASGITTWERTLLKSDVSHEDVQVAFDDNQFLWVDGREGNETVRVIIDVDSKVKVSTIGVKRPLYKPEVVGVGFSNKNDEGTGIKRGKIFLICYTYVNDREEESNPSPVAVVDDLQYYSRGYYEKDGEQYYYPITYGKYYHDNNITGSITNIDIKATVDYDGIRRINVYLAEADYGETVIPPTGLRLITSRIVPRKTSNTAIVIAMPASMILASYENDIAPKGDAVTLTGGTAFIGNAVNDLGLPHPVAAIWRITLSNLNKFNYTNKWIRLDLFPEEMRDRITQDVFEKLGDWDTLPKHRFRIMDSDMITPLEVFYYKDEGGGGGNGFKIHKDIKVIDNEYNGIRAHLNIYLPIPNQDYRVEAVNEGVAGNAYTIRMKRGTLQADLLIDEDSGDTIIFVADDIIDNIGIKLIAPGTASALKLDLKEDSPQEYRLEITLASYGDGTVYSTTKDVIEFIELKIADVLAGIIKEVRTSSYGVFDTSRVLDDSNNMDESQLFECSTTAEIVGNDITVFLGYQVAAGEITATMADVSNAINNTPDVKDAIRFVSTEQLEATAIETSPQSLAGGLDPSGGEIAQGDIINTSMLVWIRIPQILAHQDKAIYLVEFAENPTKIENSFVPLVLQSPAGDELSVAEFYERKFVRNPIPNEGTYVASGYDISDTLQIDVDERLGYAKKNAAGMLAPIIGIDNDVGLTDGTVVRYDEWANGATGGFLVTHDVATLERYIELRYFRCGVNLTDKGYMWGSTVIPNDGEVSNNTKIHICNVSALVGTSPFSITAPIVTAYIRKFAGAWYLYIDNPVGSLGTIHLPNNFDFVAGDRIHVVVSWDGDKMFDGEPLGGGASPIQIIRVGVLINSKFQWYKYSSRNYSDSTIEMVYVDRPKHPAMLGLRTGIALKDDWQLLSVLRTLPVFPTSSIGALDKFEIMHGVSNGIVHLNNNVSIERMSVAHDTSPGRIQWGAYGVMPDLNEYNIHEDIMGLCPIKSFQPTDEHNTILVFTRENTYILALLGDSANSCTVVKQLSGIGLMKRGALCATHNGVVWLSQQGIMHITAEGTENLSRGRIDVQYIDSLIYDPERNWLWARGKYATKQYTYVYQLYEGLWWKYSGTVQPDTFLGTFDGSIAWACYTDKKIYKDSITAGYATDGNNPTLIKTRGIALQRRLGRVKLVGDLSGGKYKLKAHLFSNKMGSSSETAEFEADMNGRIAIPGLAADYVQIDMKEINKAIALSIEYEDGVKR